MLSIVKKCFPSKRLTEKFIQKSRVPKKLEYNKQYYANNRKTFSEYSRQYYKDHEEKIVEKAKARYQAKRDDLLEQKKVYYAKNRERIKAAVRQRSASKTPEERILYYANHREALLAKGHRRRARKLNAPLNDLTRHQWETIKEHYRHKCVYCGKRFKRLTQDHILPLAKGGSHTMSNVVPACKLCNSKKNDGPPLKPVQPLLL